MVQWVWEGASRSERLERVIIATDSTEIMDVCSSFGAECFMTPSELPSGTDRAAYVYEKEQMDYDAIVNIQGDEPLVTGEIIDKLIDGLTGSLANVSTLISRIHDSDEITDPNTVKVVMQSDSTALYFSRSPIPFFREEKTGINTNLQAYYKHIGIYAYREAALRAFTSLPPSELEETEKLEQLRLLQNNYKYLCVEIGEKLHGVDTLSDLQKVRMTLNRDK